MKIWHYSAESSLSNELIMPQIKFPGSCPRGKVSLRCQVARLKSDTLRINSNKTVQGAQEERETAGPLQGDDTEVTS